MAGLTPPHMTADAVQACAVSILGPLATFERTQPKVHSVSSQKLLLLGIQYLPLIDPRDAVAAHISLARARARG